MASSTKEKSSWDALLDRLTQHAQQEPDKTVLTFLNSKATVEKEYTYQALEQETSQVASYLLQSGLQQGDRALLVYPPCLEFVVAFLACLKAGIVAVPVFPPHPARRDTWHMFSQIAASSSATVALTSNEYQHLKKLANIQEAFTKWISRKQRPTTSSWPDHLKWITTDDRKVTTANTSASFFPKRKPSDLAFLQYTSGSTSEPKGVMITQENLAHNLTLITRELKAGKDTVVVSWLPQYHDMGLIGSYLGTIYCGGSGYYMSPLTFLQRPMIWMEAVSKYGATHLQAPNFAYKLTARKFQPSDYVNRPLDFSKIRHMINAAEPVDEDSMNAFYKAFGPFGMKRVIFPTYGLAEHTVFVCSGGKQILSVRKATLEVDGQVQVVDDEEDPSTVSRLVGCGYPKHQPGVDVRIVDHDTFQELPENRVGEIWVTSESKAAGYYGMRQESKANFHARLKDTTSGGGYLRTGDLGFLHKEELFICGRLKDLIIVGGRNYYPQDIEATAEATSDQLRPGCSAAFTIDPTRQGGEEVALVMELREVPPSKQIEEVGQKLALEVRSAITQEHSLGVAKILFLQTKTVPKTTSGKIARAWCRKGYLAKTLKVVYEKSFLENQSSSIVEQEDLGEEAASSPSPSTMTAEQISQLRSKSTAEIRDQLRLDISRLGQVPQDSIDDDTALVTILDSMSLSQFKGRLENAYAVKEISDEYLFGESTTLTKLAEIVKLGYAPDDHNPGTNTNANGTAQPSAPVVSHQGTADGLAGALGCPPGVVCCVIQ